jgi:hypothetical protein
MLVAIVQRDELTDLRLKARLLAYFPYHRFRRGLPHIGPPPWERPQTIGVLTDEQHAVVVKDRSTYVYLGSSVPLFSTEEMADQRRVHVRKGGENVCRDAAHVLVAFAVKGVFTEHEAILRDRLETSHPC